jgi:hypothetical protein
MWRYHIVAVIVHVYGVGSRWLTMVVGDVVRSGNYEDGGGQGRRGLRIVDGTKSSVGVF